MSKKDFPEMTQHARQKLATQVKSVREGLGMTQVQLALRAGTSRQTIISLERGLRVPQAATLQPILGVLGISDVETNHEEDTQAWLNAIGAILDTLPSQARARAGESAFNAVTAELVEHAKANVTPSGHNESAKLPVDVEAEWALAAHPDSEEPEDHTA